MCLGVLFSALAPRKKQDRIGALDPHFGAPGMCFVFWPFRLGKSTGANYEYKIAYRATNISVKNIGNIYKKKWVKNQFGITSSSRSGFAQILLLVIQFHCFSEGIVSQFIQICVSGYLLAIFHASLVELGLEVGRSSGTKLISGHVLSV